MHFSSIAIVALRYFRQYDFMAKFSLSCQPFSWFHRSGSLMVEKGKCHAHPQENKEIVDIPGVSPVKGQDVHLEHRMYKRRLRELSSQL